MNEEWRLIFDGLYEVSNLGRVRRAVDGVNTKAGDIRSPGVKSSGYHQVALYKNGKATNRSVHRLVVEAFIGKIPKGMEVNHKDGNKLNNQLDNLEIVTKSENMKHAIQMGLHTPPKNRATGDRHWTKLHPHLVAKGDRNGAKTKPECTLKGSQCPSSKLTEDAVRQIRRLADQGVGKKEIAAKFNVTTANIRYIVNRQSWKHVQ